MRITEMIRVLQNFLQEEGDLEVIVPEETLELAASERDFMVAEFEENGVAQTALFLMPGDYISKPDLHLC